MLGKVMKGEEEHGKEDRIKDAEIRLYEGRSEKMVKK